MLLILKEIHHDGQKIMKALASFIIITLFLTTNSFAELEQKALKDPTTNSKDLAKRASKFLKQYGNTSANNDQASNSIKQTPNSENKIASSTNKNSIPKDKATSSTQEVENKSVNNTSTKPKAKTIKKTIFEIC